MMDLRRDVVDLKVREIAEEILTDVKKRGEEALLHHSVRLGDSQLICCVLISFLNTTQLSIR